MRKSVMAVVGTLTCLGVAFAEAHATELTGAEIKALLAGATVEIDTPTGTRLPVRYGPDGRLAGKARDLAWYLGAASDRGRWWVASGQLCHRWRRWFNGQSQCLRLAKRGRLIHWRSRDGYSGTARISVPPRVRTTAAPMVPPASKAPPAPAKASDPVGGHAGVPKAGQSEASATDIGPTPPRPVPATPPATRKQLAPQEQAESGGGDQRLFRVANIRDGDVLNIRSGPSADFDIIGTLPPGSRGIALTSSCRSRWCPVRHGATRGWVHSAYLAPEGPRRPRPLRTGQL